MVRSRRAGGTRARCHGSTLTMDLDVVNLHLYGVNMVYDPTEDAAMDVPTALEVDPSVHRRRWLILGVLCLSLFVVVMDGTIVNVALPSLVTELGATTRQLQWIVD